MIEDLNGSGMRALANQPYLGIDDGLTTHFRIIFLADVYAGIEIEINNRFTRLSARTQSRWLENLSTAISSSVVRLT